MNMINTVLVIGNFKHFTSKKGTLPLNFIVENKCRGSVEKINVSVADKTIAKSILDGRDGSCKIKVYGSIGSKGINATNVIWE